MNELYIDKSEQKAKLLEKWLMEIPSKQKALIEEPRLRS